MEIRKIKEKEQIKRAEKIFKGAANHWRLEILLLLDKNPGMSVDEVSQAINAVFLTTANHLRILSIYKLVYKNYKGRNVIHTITPTGKNILTLFKML